MTISHCGRTPLRGGKFHVPWERKLVEAAGIQYIIMRLSGIWAPKDEY